MSIFTSSFTKKTLLSSLIAWEVDPQYTRNGAVLTGGDGAVRAVAIGTILAMQLTVASVAAATVGGAGNVGDGTIAMSGTPVTSAVKVGDYKVSCTEPGGSGVAVFSVEAPDGGEFSTVKSDAVHGSQVKFTITAGGTDFDAGDSFTITITAEQGDSTGKLVEWDPDAIDGTEVIHSLSLQHAEAPDATDIDLLIMEGGPSVVLSTGIQWPAGVSDAQKYAAMADLHLLGIKVRG